MDVYTAGLINSELRQRLLSREAPIITVSGLKVVVATILAHMSKIINQTPKEDLRFNPKGLGLTVTKTTAANDLREVDSLLKALDATAGTSSVNNMQLDPYEEEEIEEQLLFFMDEDAEVKRGQETAKERAYWEIGMNDEALNEL